MKKHSCIKYMQNKNARRGLALLLAFALVLSIGGAGQTVFASETDIIIENSITAEDGADLAENESSDIADTEEIIEETAEVSEIVSEEVIPDDNEAVSEDNTSAETVSAETVSEETDSEDNISDETISEPAESISETESDDAEEILSEESEVSYVVDASDTDTEDPDTDTEDTADVLYDYYEAVIGTTGSVTLDPQNMEDLYASLAEDGEVLQSSSYDLTFASTKPAKITITEDGVYEALVVGLAKIKVTADYTATFVSYVESEESGSEDTDDDTVDTDPSEEITEPEEILRTVTGTETFIYYMRCIPDMTEVSLASKSELLYYTGSGCASDGTVTVELNSGTNGTYQFSESSDYTDFSLYSCKYEDPYLSYSLDKNVLTLSTVMAGHNHLVFLLNGKKLVINLHSYCPTLTTTLLLAKGSSKTLKVKSLPSSETVTWSIGNTDVATISASGKVTAKGVGSTYLIARFGNVKMCTVINVASVKMYKAILAGISIGTGTYSQPKRMYSGYWDCSALVWRAYSPYGYYFGNKTYAPTAAREAQYLAGKGKIYIETGEYTYARTKKLRTGKPGDLLFLTGASNGRYRGIYHVEIICGYEFTGFTSSGSCTCQVVYATGTNGRFDDWDNVIVGRPVK